MKTKIRQSGFSLVELLVGTCLFTVVAGSVFALLMSSQVRYQNESGLTSAFQQANVAIDQITRDIHSAGYPPQSLLTTGTATNFPQNFALPFAWAPNYPIASCKVGSCATPGPYDLIIEADVGSGVQWIRYRLDGTTLLRGVARKAKFADPSASTNGVLSPYLENVLNLDKDRPIFTYVQDPGVSAPFLPIQVRQVNVCLIVRSMRQQVDTGTFSTVTVTGQARRFNEVD